MDSLRLKEELLSITKEKWQSEKLKTDETIEQLKFSIELTTKKLSHC